MKSYSTQNKYNYLRLSVTDKCNLNCGYCGPRDRVRRLRHEDTLRYEEMLRVIELSTGLGIRRVRITGGEPLIKKNLIYLIEELKRLPLIEEVSMTTNGILFWEKAEDLKRAGLDRVNISLDTLKRERYSSLTGEDGLDSVWKSIMKAMDLDLSPVKLNVILFQGVNDDEIFDFVELTKKYPLCVRFIEYMETVGKRDGYRFVSNEVILERLKERYKLVDCLEKPKGNGPSKYIRLEKAKGEVGFISPNTDCFCESCNRLRLSCDGKLHPCLFSSHYLDVRDLVRGGQSDEVIMEKVALLMESKHRFTRWNEPKRGDATGLENEKRKPSNIDMCYIGG